MIFLTARTNKAHFKAKMIYLGSGQDHKLVSLFVGEAPNLPITCCVLSCKITFRI